MTFRANQHSTSAIRCFPARHRVKTGTLLILPVLISMSTSLPGSAPAHDSAPTTSYPETRRDAVVDTFHGEAVEDPYRWLEDPTSDDTRRWIEAQNRVTEAYLADIPERDALRERLTQLWDFERYGLPYQRGGRYFFTRNDGLQNQAVLHVSESLDAAPRVLLDPNLLSEDGTTALAGTSVSDDGRLLAYGLSRAGSDWQEWRVRDIDSGRDLDDHLRWIKFSGASWAPDHSGFYYSRYDQPEPGAEYTDANHFPKIHFHRIGTPQEEDELIYERPDQKDWGLNASVTDDGRYLIIRASRGTDPRNGIFYRDLEQPGSPVVELLNEFDASYSLVDNDGPRLWFHTDLDAPLGRVIEIDLTRPQRDQWREIIAESDATLRGVSRVGDLLFASWLRDACSDIGVFTLDGRLQGSVDLPGAGTAMGFGGDRHDRETFYFFTSPTDPGTSFHYDLASGESRVFRRPRVDFDFDAYHTRQVFVESADGTRVPMFLTHRRDLEPDGDTPVYLYGYGGFRISMTPAYSTFTSAWIERGGIFASVCLRGGGEYGEAWHHAGRLANKQNVFDDFIAAAEWLIDSGHTNPSRLAIGGGSNGGLLVGACMIQRPDLFAAALPAVGVFDMLRYHKFTIGWAWMVEFGDPGNEADFRVLRAYSPLHNLRPGTRYPSTLITTGDHDDRVVPAHSFKFAAALQHAHRGDNPVLIRIETSAGHGAGKPTRKIIEEATDKLAFLIRELGMTEPSP